MYKNRSKFNSTELVYNNIHFKSKLEVDCYKLFEVENLPVKYESISFELIPKLKLQNLLVYLPGRKTKINKVTSLKEVSGILQNAKYTPDFIIEYKEYTIFIETKGRANDAYPMRRKLFFHYLENRSLHEDCHFIFFEPHNKVQILETIQIIKNL